MLLGSCYYTAEPRKPVLSLSLNAALCGPLSRILFASAQSELTATDGDGGGGVK